MILHEKAPGATMWAQEIGPLCVGYKNYVTGDPMLLIHPKKYPTLQPTWEPSFEHHAFLKYSTVIVD